MTVESHMGILEEEGSHDQDWRYCCMVGSRPISIPCLSTFKKKVPITITYITYSVMSPTVIRLVVHQLSPPERCHARRP